MKINKKLFSFVLILFAFILVFSFYKTSDEETKIRAVFKELVKLSKIEKKLHVVESVTRASEVSKFLATPFEIDFKNEGYELISIKDKKSLKQRSVQGYAALSSFETMFSISSIEIKGSSADVIGVASAKGSINSEGEFFDQHKVLVKMNKQDGEWLVQSVKHIKNMRT